MVKKARIDPSLRKGVVALLRKKISESFGEIGELQEKIKALEAEVGVWKEGVKSFNPYLDCYGAGEITVMRNQNDVKLEPRKICGGTGERQE